MNNQRVSKIAIQCINRYRLENKHSHLQSVSYGNLNLLHEIYDKCKVKIKNEHPINKWQYVLNALDRESKREGAIFQKEYFRANKGSARMFIVKDKSLLFDYNSVLTEEEHADLFGFVMKPLELPSGKIYKLVKGSND